LRGGGFSSDGERVSPKITAGVTPVQGFTVYGLYAEGYRAPAVTEALIAGLHPFPAVFTFLPNPGLRPEVGKTLEAGVNLKYDSLFTKDDRFRAKANVFRNNVSNYIDLAMIPFIGPIGPCPVPPFCFQYQNIAQARLEGVEFESTYDAGSWFAGLSGHHIRGRNVTAGVALLTVPPDQIATTLGARFFDRKFTAALRWAAVAAKRDVPAGAIKTPAYDLVNLYFAYQPHEDIVAALSIENLLDRYYFNYLDVQTARIPARGLTVKGSLKFRFSDKTLGKG
jgi:hemoglobin/transferrin/lactoferrin receptor protein